MDKCTIDLAIMCQLVVGSPGFGKMCKCDYYNDCQINQRERLALNCLPVISKIRDKIYRQWCALRSIDDASHEDL